MTKKLVGKKVSKKTATKKSTNIHKKPTVSKVTNSGRKNPYPISELAKKIVTGGIVAAAVIVLLSLVFCWYFEPSRVAERKLDELARDYYENYFYDRFVESLDGESFAEAVEAQQGTGFSTVALRHLLLFDNGRDSDYAKYFDNSGYICDASMTTIRIIPKGPFEKTDYDIIYTYSCNYR